jgi:aminopeptidase N
MTYSNPQPVHLQDYLVPDYLIEKVDLEVDLNEDFTIVKAHLTVFANPDQAKIFADLTLVGEALELLSVAINGKLLTADQYRKTDSSLTLLSVPSRFELDIETRILPEQNTALSGLYKSSGNYCTQCEAEGFRRITYFLDRPDVMARYTTTIMADQARYPILLSNGNLVDKGQLQNGRHWVRWEDPFKKPCYLFALVAGDLEFVEDHFITMSGRRITLRIFVEKGNQDKCAHAMQAVKKAMRWDEEAYGREYDLDIYMIVAVSDFNMGAMENKGLNIFNTKYILAKPDTATDDDFLHVESVIAHEYFHNWSGNRVTCRDWFQLSLKEGLTIFRDQSFTADTASRTVARIHDVNALRTTQFPEDMGPLAHPVRPDSYIEINNFYTSTIYNKGAEVIRMMQTMLGEKLFRKGMDLYFSRHDGQAVTIEDFARAMEDASGMDLAQFRLWYSQAGTPVLDITDSYAADSKIYTLTIKQSCRGTPGQVDKKPFHIPVKMGLLDQAGQEIAIDNHLLQVKKPVEVFEFKNIASQPIPSLLRGFSAPVKANYSYSDEFNRWEAGQKYAINILLKLISAHQKGEKLIAPLNFIAAFQYVLRTQQEDKWLLAEMLMLPSEKYLAEQMAVIDIEAIHAAREFLLQEIAVKTQDLFLETYQQNQTRDNPYEFTVPAVGQRQLKNICLAYLMLLPDAEIYQKLSMQQFTTALSVNMTDTMGALRTLVNIEGPERELALKKFYETWKDNALVVDKWFALQAISKLPGTLQNVKKLLQHEAFDIKNPNKVYALIGAFGHQNLFHFHASNGDGYAFLAEIVQQLDGLNPQVAARMIQPLIQWQRYDKKRQELMRKQLEIISKNPKISNDVYELVNKSLAE